MHGNVWVWCQDSHDRDLPAGSSVIEDIEDHPIVSNAEERMLRGGSFYNPSVYVRAADRYWYVPTHHFRNMGFRVARTIR
jgi:formylglycine-generating enzyme required for sulfatase activity